MIERISDPAEKKRISRTILEARTDWFGIQESREEYIENSGEQIFLADIRENDPLGFLCLKETGKDTLELAVMGVMKEYHRKGIGRELFDAAKEHAAHRGYSF